MYLHGGKVVIAASIGGTRVLESPGWIDFGATPVFTRTLIVDTFLLSTENPWQSWMRPGGFDFTPDGKAAMVATWNGDVWRVDGVMAAAPALLRWRRIVSGLFQPLGVKFRGDDLFITCRDQLLRFFADKSLREVSDALGISDDTAQKRVNRALERLRDYFARRGVVVPAALLGSTLVAHTVEAAPAQLASTLAASAAASGTGLGWAPIKP